MLLLAAVPDYRVSVDSGYHVSLARWYAEHGSAFWDWINYGPGGRPNLQGPALHVAIALGGRLLGGYGDAYVLANALLAVAQWAAAMLTAVFFARRLGGDWAALLAGALLSGNLLAAGSFAIGIPSGWVFILTPWAVHFFLRRQLALAALATSLAIYFHLAGYATVPAGILVAALLTRRWRSLLVTGAATVVLTLPYTVHFLRHLDWYRGQHGHVAVAYAPLIYLAALPGLLWLLRRPRQQAFLVAWVAAPLPWLVQDYTRFLSQSTLALSVLGGVWIARQLARPAAVRWQPAAATALVALATLPSPLNQASVLAEAAWDAGIRYPRFVDWHEARTVAAVIQRVQQAAMRRAGAGRPGVRPPLVAPYNPSECIRFAVYAPMQFEKGHWVEVQPRHDPADELSEAAKIFVLPLPPTDPALVQAQARGWLRVEGGSATTTVATLGAPPPLAAVAPVAAHLFAGEASWLAAHAQNNVLPPPSVIVKPAALALWRQVLLDQRTHAGRLQLAMVLYAYALEGPAPRTAHAMRGAVRGFGSIANFLGDDEALGFVTQDRHQLLRHNLAALAAAAASAPLDHPGNTTFGAALDRLFDDYFTAA